MSATNERKDNVFLGVCLIIATVFTMAFTDAIIKFISSDFPLWQIFVVRSLAAISILIGIVLFAWKVDDIRPMETRWTILRSLLLAFMYIAIYAAVPLLDLSVIAASLYTGPIFVALLSAFLIGEPVGARGWGAVALGFLGVVVIIRPAAGDFNFYALIPVLAGLFYALAAIITRTRCRDEKPQVLAILLNLAILVVGLAATGVVFLLQPWTQQGAVYPFLLGNWISMGSREWGIIALLSVLIVIIGIGLAKAYQSANPAIIATFDYSYLLFAALWGFLFFHEVPDLRTIVGMVLIVAAGVLVIRVPANEAPPLTEVVSACTFRNRNYLSS